MRPSKYLRKRRVFLGGGGGERGGGGGGAVDPVDEDAPKGGFLGGFEFEPETGDRDDGGAVRTSPTGGVGTFGTLSGGITVLEDGLTGEAGVLERMGPGGGGCGCDAVVLSVPGSTTVLESCMLGFVFGSGGLESAEYRYMWCQSVTRDGAILCRTCNGYRVVCH